MSFANGGILGKAIVPTDPQQYPAELRIPKVSEIYVNPRYRVVAYDGDAQPASESWWSGKVARNDFDVLFAAHVTSADATRLPLLLLGHPGAGKSMLTKVLAARLPDTEYTVVRVPLRRVTADARIHRQIEEALDISTQQRIEWSELAEQSRDTVRVVLLDGLDELLQASEHDRSRYLEDVVEFQEREAEQRRPVVVVVTSRTVVAERVRIPEGTTVVKLDPFSDEDIAEWVGRWNGANAAAIVAETIGELTVAATRRRPELAEQPLLLMMIALYAADRTLPALEEIPAAGELYQQLLRAFARREAAKELGLGHDPSDEELEQRVEDHLERLTVAALGMFNRGRQDIHQAELVRDLESLTLLRVHGSQAGQRVIGEFFFVHVPEAQTGTTRASDEPKQRAYEFLHATFSENLVARRVMDELLEIARSTFSNRRGRAELHDEMLFALLSHQALAARQSMLDFTHEILESLTEEARGQVFETLELLIRNYRSKRDSNRYDDYRPTEYDYVRQLGFYSANLIALLKVVMQVQGADAKLNNLFSGPKIPVAGWQSMVRLWHSALDTDSLRSMLATVELTSDGSAILPQSSGGNLSSFNTTVTVAIDLARLARDPGTERALRFGAAITDDLHYNLNGDSWSDVMLSSLIPATAGFARGFLIPELPPGTSDADIQNVTDVIFRLLESGNVDDRMGLATELIKLITELPDIFELDPHALAVTVLHNPHLRDAVMDLADSRGQQNRIFGRYERLVAEAPPKELLPFDDPLLEMSPQTIAALVAFIRESRS